MDKNYINTVEDKLFKTVRSFFDKICEKITPYLKKAAKDMNIKNLPDILTFSRFLGLPFSIIFYIGIVTKNPWMIFLSYIFEILLGFTDLFDGYLAREPEFTETDFGKLIDPFADKVFTISNIIFITLAINILVNLPFQIILWIIIGIYLALELSLVFMAKKAEKLDKKLLGANDYGKTKFTSICTTFLISAPLLGIAVFQIIPVEIPYSIFVFGMIITKYFAIKSITTHINEFKNLMA